MWYMPAPAPTPATTLPTPASSAEAAAAVLELLDRQLPDSSAWLVAADGPARALRIVDASGDTEHAFGGFSPAPSPETGVVEVPASAEDGTGAFMAIPIVLSDGGSAGTLCAMARGGRSYTAEERRLLERSAGLLSYAIEREREAATDPLTGVANRRAFLDALEREWARREHDGRGSLVCVIDLDGFKRINDTYGHAAGDDALRRVSQALLDTTRASDCVGRIGGDEFAVLLTGAQAAAAGAAFEWRVRSRLRELTGPGEPHVELSFGFDPLVATDSPDAALEAADQAMYLTRAAHRERRLVGAARTVAP